MAGENTNENNETKVEDGENKNPVLPDPNQKPDDSQQKPDDNDKNNKPDDSAANTDGDTPDVEDDKPKEFDKEVWGTTGDEVGDSVLQLLSDNGMTTDDAKALLFDPVKNGDPTKIDRDALVEKVGKAQANLILAGVENFVSKRNAAAEAGVKVVHDAAGGKEAWDKVLPWLNSKAVSEEDRAEYRDLIDKGGKSAELAVRDIVSKYNADPKNEAIGKKEVIGDGRSNSEPKGISQRQYGDQLLKLQRTGKATPEARAALLAQRRLGRKQGI